MYRVLVIEDSELLRKGLVYTTDWQALHCEVVGQADNGIEGEKAILSLKPDIVVTDIRMPGKTGLEMMRDLVGKTEASYIIITAFNEFEYAREALQMGAVDYLSKPIEDGALERAVGKTVDVIRQRQEYKKFKGRLENIEDSKIMLFKEYLTGGGSIQENHVDVIVRFITCHYGEDIGTKEILRNLKISESHSNRLMKEVTGYTVSDYLQNYRIKRACELLSDPSVKVYEVADKVGIRDQRYFSVVFKKLVGLTPREFQNRLFR
jgi:two-component system response regulator YesN